MEPSGQRQPTLKKIMSTLTAMPVNPAQLPPMLPRDQQSEDAASPALFGGSQA
jgi:hypothetical protein